MNNDKTIKQLADELGVSKQTVQYHYKSLPAKGSKTNDKGVIVLNSFGIKWLTEKIKVKKSFFVDKELAKESTNNSLAHESFFIDQLKEKDKQIMKLIENQERLEKLLDQQQILTLQANKKIEELELKSNEGESQKKENEFSFSEEQEENQEMKKEDSSIEKNVPGTSDKKNFWARWFKK